MTRESHHPRTRSRPPEAVAEGIAARQHGLVTRGQLLDAGVSVATIDRRVRAGRLVRAYRGVYRVGPLSSPRTREMAALLAYGPRAAITHETAAALRELAGARRPGRAVDVALRSGNRRPRRGIRLHRLTTLTDGDVTTVDGLAVTTAARTLLDLAPRWRPGALERALADALDRGLLTTDAMRGLLERHPGYPGTRRLRCILLDGDDPALTRSELEADFLALVRRAKVELPETNVRIGSYEVDFYWPEERLAVELDGFPYHSGRDAFERDRIRDADLAPRGITVIRITARRLTREPEAVLVQLGGALLARR